MRESGSDSVFGACDGSSPGLPAVLRRKVTSSASRNEQLGCRSIGADASEVIDGTSTGEPFGSHSSLHEARSFNEVSNGDNVGWRGMRRRASSENGQ